MTASRKPVRYTVHPAVAMAQAIIGNLGEKTGRSLEHWIENIERDGPPDTKARLSWLKREHGLGGTTGKLIVYRAEGRGEELSDAKAYLCAAKQYIEAMYAGPKASLRPLHDALVEQTLALGSDVKVSPAKTIVPIYRNHVFAQIKPATRTRIDLGLALKDVSRRIPKRLINTGGLEKGDRITHRIPLSQPSDIDATVLEWLRLAYDLDG